MNSVQTDEHPNKQRLSFYVLDEKYVQVLEAFWFCIINNIIVPRKYSPRSRVNVERLDTPEEYTAYFLNNISGKLKSLEFLK